MLSDRPHLPGNVRSPRRNLFLRPARLTEPLADVLEQLADLIEVTAGLIDERWYTHGSVRLRAAADALRDRSLSADAARHQRYGTPLARAGARLAAHVAQRAHDAAQRVLAEPRAAKRSGGKQHDHRGGSGHGHD